MTYVGPQALPTLLKVIAVNKGAYPNLIVHSLKRLLYSNTRRVDRSDQSFDLPTISLPTTPLGFKPVTSALIPLVGPWALPTLLKTIDSRVKFIV